MAETENPPDECPNCHYSVTFWIGHVDETPLTLKDFVRTNIVKLDASQSAWEAARLMKENDTENVLVTVGGESKGIVTERDILYKIAAEDLPASKVLLKKIMSTPIISVDSNTPVTEAIKLMAKYHIRRLVVTEGGKTIGIASQRSIIGGSFRLTKDST